MGTLVPLKRTTPSRDEFIEAMAAAWSVVFPSTAPNRNILSTLYAQFAFETGWGKSCWNNNVGNERTGSLNPPNPNGWSGDYIELKTADEWVVVNGERKHVVVGGYFRAWNTLFEGCVGHLDFLLSLKPFRLALNILLGSSIFLESDRAAGETARMFAEALKQGGYFTGDLDAYRSGLQSIAVATFKAIVPPEHMSYEPWTRSITSLPWYPNEEWGGITVDTGLAMIFGDDYQDHDQKLIAHVTASRWDCQNGEGAPS